MIYIVQVPSLQKFRDNFVEYKEINIAGNTVLHLSVEVFLNQCFNGINRNTVMLLSSLLNNCKLIQIEEK
jgi:hypothetical protein